MWYKKKKTTTARTGGQRKTLEGMNFRELVNVLDREFSFWVRASACNGAAVPCYTCGKYYPLNEIDAGHYISRANYGLRWDTMNVKPQCRSENRFQNGVHDKFRARLVEEYGEDEVRRMESFAAFYGKARPPREQLIEMIKQYRAENKRLKEKLTNQ